MDLKIKLPFHKRILVYSILVFVLYMLFFVLFQYQREKIYKATSLNYRLQAVNTYIEETTRNTHDFTGILDKYKDCELKDIRITVIDTLGKVLFDSHNIDNNITFNNHSNRPEFIQAMQTGMGYTIHRLSESTHQEYFYSATRINDIIVRSALPYNLTLKDVLKTDSNFLGFMLMVTLVISSIFFVITRRLGRNIIKLRRFAIKASRGERMDDIGEFPNDELGEISTRVVELYNELKDTKERLEGEHKLTMLHEQEKAQLKKQLTQNINHELKTPVSSIKGYLEIMIDNPDLDDAKRVDFLNKSYSQIERLTQLLLDISTITRMDEASDMIVKQDLELGGIIKDVLSEALPKIESTGVITECVCQPPMYMQGNQTLLHSVFANLMDNALSYSGCSKIKIVITESLNSYHVSFSDNGIGISNEHLDRIFERFYRIDKGRSRKIGGTGLGLSIVKNAVLLHSGTITAKERIGGGTEFLFTLSKL